MNKQIIHNIDFSGCIYYKDGKCLNGEIMQSNCKNVAVCYYKEYKRKEQECERLTSTLTDIKEIAEHCIKQDICTFCDYSDKCHIEDEEIPSYDICKLILQKISEVEDVGN